MPTLSTSSADVLRSQLKGVRVEFGSLVRFRDAPAFEMVMRLNQRHKGGLVSTILSEKSECNDHSRPKHEENGISECGVDKKTEECRSVFVPELYVGFLESEMQKWLDPFRGRGEDKGKRKRTRDGRNESSSSSDDDDDNDDALNDTMIDEMSSSYESSD